MKFKENMFLRQVNHWRYRKYCPSSCRNACHYCHPKFH